MRPTTRSLIALALLAAASCALPAPAFAQATRTAPSSPAASSASSGSSDASAPSAPTAVTASPSSASVDGTAPAAAAGVSSGVSSVASASSTAPAPAPAPAPDSSGSSGAPLVSEQLDPEVVSEEELTRRSKEQNIEDWFKRHTSLMLHRFDTELYNWLHAAKEDLKKVLGLAPPSA